MHYLEAELRQRLRDDSEVFGFLRKACLDGMWFWDLENPDNEWMDDSFWLTLGRDPFDIPHHPDAWREVMHPEDIEEAARLVEAHLADPSRPFDHLVRYRHVSGRWLTLRCRGMAIRDADGKPIRMLGAHSDVTELSQAKSRLTRTVSDLEKARDEALTASRAKSSFLANMSHELRTPLNGVLGIAQAMLDSELTDAQRRMMEVLRNAGDDLVSLIDNILDLSRIEAGQMVLEAQSFDPEALLRHIAGLFESKAAEKGIALELDLARLPKAVVGSDLGLRQVVTNLVSNAIKFTDEGGITISARMSDPQTLAVCVTDTGPGVPDDLRDAIFDRFNTGLHAHEDTRGGAGLGLAIARRICALAGGTLELVRTDAGARFRASIRVAAQGPFEIAANEAERPIPSRARKLRLLVAEDNEMNRFVIETLLDGMNAEIEFAHDGVQALEMLEEGYDGVLMDIRMPQMTGQEATRRWRAMERRRPGRHLPIVACSANAMPHQIEEYLKGGFDRHLAKPIRVEALRETLDWLAAPDLAEAV